MLKTKPNPPQWQSRNDLPLILNELQLLGTGVEVGCQRGVFGSHVRAGWNGEHQIEVDPWRPYATDVTAEMHQGYMTDAIRHMHATNKSFQIWCMTAIQAADHVSAHRKLGLNGGCFDWIYLDGDHSYEAVKEEIDAFWPLLNRGGVMAFHDFISDGWHRHGDPINAEPNEVPGQTGPGPFYVRRAVYEQFNPEHIAITSPHTDMGWMSALVVKA